MPGNGSTYKRLKKAEVRDTYGVWSNGVRQSAEIIAGKRLDWKPSSPR